MPDDPIEYLKKQFAVLNTKIDSLKDVLSEHGEKITLLENAMYNGVQSKILELSEQFTEQLKFCKHIQEEKEKKKVDRLEALVSEQKAIIEAGGNRRRTIWAKMPWWQKTGVIFGFVGIIFMLPYLIIFITNILKLFGIEVGIPTE
jgi:hypothetical protein